MVSRHQRTPVRFQAAKGTTDKRFVTARVQSKRAELQEIDRNRSSLLRALLIISLCLAGAVSLLLPFVRAGLPDLGIGYTALQAGVVLLVAVFGIYALDRERRLRRTTESLIAQQREFGRLSNEIEVLKRMEIERDSMAALLGASADGILVVSKDRTIAQSNPALSDLAGRDLEEGMLCEDLLGCRREDGTLACGECPFARVFSNSRPVTDHSFQIRRPDGATVWLSGAYAPVLAGEGDSEFVIGSLRDVTRGKEVEQLQQDFVSIVSHELRGPLTAIKGFVKTLLVKSDRLPPETRLEFLKTINEQADRLNQLVEDLLNVSRIESRRLKMKLSPVDLPELTNKLISQFSSKWGDRTITVCAPDGLPTLAADESKIEEVLVNLIDNAVKYSPHGGEVKVTMQALDGQIEVAVEDSGLGISAEDAAKLFEKFHRVSTPETRDIGGTGLGLYIVKSLVEAHGGRIEVTSAPNVGSTFTFTLPRHGPPNGQAWP